MHLRPKCAKCFYWAVDQTADPATSGHCHRYPPGVAINPQTGTVVQKFPSTDHHQWCGEWSEEVNRLADAVKRSLISHARV